MLRCLCGFRVAPAVSLACYTLAALQFPASSVTSSRTWRPDAVITIAPSSSVHLVLYCLLLSSRRTVTWLHIQDFELDAAFELGLLKGRLLRSLAESFERRILRRFDCVSTISTAMLRRLNFKGVDPQSSFFLPNWVDLNAILPQPISCRSQNSYYRELDISPDQIVLMYSGSMNKKQGLDLLVDVIHQLADLPQLWLFAGDGPTKSDLMFAKGISNVRHLPLQLRSVLTIGSTWLIYIFYLRKQRLQT